MLMINNGRGSLDFVRRLLADDNDDDPQQGPVNNAVPRWCIYGNCIQMPTPGENKCCQRRECITSYELFNNLCIVQHVLELAIRARCGAPGLFNGQFQKSCVQAFFLKWEHGYLGKGNRRVIPSFSVKKVRQNYPAPDNVYLGFRSD